MARDFRNLKFGVDIHTSIRPGVDSVAEALHAEQLGFDNETPPSDSEPGEDSLVRPPPILRSISCLL